ncbi:MAG: PD40 domain-containing protein [Bacteroidetes bacterium]|nr:PD40 domain-containing protein [Bacteroidota bacterium]
MKPSYFPLIALLLAGCGQHKQTPQAVKPNNPPVKAYDYCYRSDNGIFLYSLADKQETRLLLNGNDVRLSPEGTHIAYTDAGAPDLERRIGMMDLADKKLIVMDSGCHNCYGPVWSPDGNYLAYNAFIDGSWSIKCVDKDNRHPVVIARASNGQTGFFSPSWSSDSKRILVQDMSTVYMFDVNGALVRSIPMSEIDTGLSVSSSSVFLLSDKGDKLIFDNDMVEETGISGPLTAIFSYDLNAGKLTRASPKGYDCFHPVLKGDTLFFGGIKMPAPQRAKPNIYSTDLNGQHFQMVFKNRQDLSCRLAKH